MRTFEGYGNPGQAYAIALSPDGRSVLSGGFNRTIKLWNAATGGVVRTFGRNEDHWVRSVAFSPDGRSVLSGGGFDGTLKLWNLASGELVRTFPGHSRVVMAVAFSPDGRNVLSAGEDGAVKVWDVATGRVLRSFVAVARHVAFFPDGRTAVASGWDGPVRILSLTTGREIVRLLAGPGGDWLAVTPAGFFDFKGDLSRFAHLVRGLDVLSIGQLHQSVYNPDLVREALAGDPAGEMAKAAKVINLEKVLDSGPAPSATIVSPADGSQTAADLVEVTVRIEDRGKGVGRIEWRVNGITVAVGAKPAGGGRVYTPPRTHWRSTPVTMSSR